MFEITGDDIAALSDTDLRTLIGRLCEAEMRRRGLSSSAVSYGGNQNAKDGGLDVRVSLPTSTPIDGFIPKAQTGFQVKRQDMPRADILDEMRPKPAGVVRPVILELADVAGAYVIVSSEGSTADSALKSRRYAMAEATKGTTAEGKLALDFYDRTRVATWVRDHAGMIAWVRSRIGKAVPGWQSYGSWSLSPEGFATSYLADGHARITCGDNNGRDAVSAIEGINQIRKVLTTPGRVVRLAGLSGVGKTRFAEALFDSSVGQSALDKSIAFYTNIADEPNPPPAVIASNLKAGNTRAILVVDNCPPGLHRQLSDIARMAGSTISVITIEYDIRDDQPEGTVVFKLETSSTELIEKLVARRYPDLSRIDAKTIAKFSEGNARVALALASRVERTERVAELSDEELFKRLFQQRHDPDPLLLSIAQACSLVYSFDGETLDGDNAELHVLGALIGKSVDDMYSGVAELRRRDLVQARAQWRAVLPHAIANRLAKMALKNIPAARVRSLLVDHASKRLFRSFSRRLGFLDDSEEARNITEAWLAPGGLLGDVLYLDELGRAILNNVAPVVPEMVLLALEKALATAGDATLVRCQDFVLLLRSLAYEPAFFERAFALLAKFAVLPQDKVYWTRTGAVESLFYVVRSGTHAPIEMRARVAEALLNAQDTRMRALGVRALDGLLKSDQFETFYEFDFGAHSRNHGYHPSTSEKKAWYSAALKLARTFALSDSPIAAKVQKIVAHEFQNLWNRSGRADELDKLARDIAAKGFWRDGWVAARRTRGDYWMSHELRTRMTALEDFLRPENLVDRVRGLVVGAPGEALYLDDFDDDWEDVEAEKDKARPKPHQTERTARAVRRLGHDVAVDEVAFRTLLPDLMSGNGREQIFGEALAKAVKNPRAMWDAVVTQFAAAEGARLTLLGGFLHGLQMRDAALADGVLDEALEAPALAGSFPTLQAVAIIDAPALARLHRALDLGIAPISRFSDLADSRACNTLSGQQFYDLVLAIARKPGGNQVGIEMISMRLHFDRSAKREPAPEVREAGRMLLSEFEFHSKDRQRSREDHDLSILVKATLGRPDGTLVVRQLCRRLMTTVANHYVRRHDHAMFLKGLLGVHPFIVLDELFSADAKSIEHVVYFFQALAQHRKNVFDDVSNDILLEWCDRNPAGRYPVMASVAPLFTGEGYIEPTGWQPLAGKLLEKAPEPQRVLNEIVRRLQPPVWYGSRPAELERRQELLKTLPGIGASSLATTVATVNARLQADIDRARRIENADAQARNKFE
ncbi:MAG TPA: hypothetical protein VMT72_10500 [Pseudolabrys sp.]|nr:hypothetical protein [Pseudolabrys sp.]